MTASPAPAPAASPKPGLYAGAFGALGVVFGDIGTSPLYTLKTVLDASGGETRQTILGVLSLIVWTLIVVASIKYASIAMRFDNDGEGGILALMALLGAKRPERRVILALGLFGAALIYGDGAITPAISVLSAVEGLGLVEPSLKRYVLPATVAILVALFAVQPMGTARIGRAFGPVMAFWFIVMALLGIGGIFKHPAVLAALNPWYGLDYLAHGGARAFVLLGSVFLCVTGAEALYADMGHFGAGPIRLGWAVLVFPSLVLNYAGQGAIVLAGESVEGNIFYRLCPAGWILPLVILSTVATIIASQSIITGAFSMTRQAIRLGWMPRLKVVQTSAQGYGQIYVGAVNWILMLATVALALGFRKSDSLAGAYGIAVSATMIFTTALLFVAMREIWGWGILASAALAGVFMVVDLAFFGSNLLKLLEGGYVPLLLAVLVYAVMRIWHTGISAINQRIDEHSIPVAQFIEQLSRDHIPRVPGTGVFLTRTKAGAPPIMRWYVKHSRALHEKVLAVNMEFSAKPWMSEADRVHVTEVAPNFWFLTASYGFMERPDLPDLLSHVAARPCGLSLDDLTYFIGVERIVPRDDGAGLPRWVASVFGAMLRNSLHASDAVRIPAAQLVDLGRQVSV